MARIRRMRTAIGGRRDLLRSSIGRGSSFNPGENVRGDVADCIIGVVQEVLKRGRGPARFRVRPNEEALGREKSDVSVWVTKCVSDGWNDCVGLNLESAQCLDRVCRQGPVAVLCALNQNWDDGARV